MQFIVGSISSILNPATFVIINFGIVVVLYSGGAAVYDGRLATGDVIALVEYMSMILVELIKLANFIITVSKMFAGARRVSRIFDIKTDMEFPSETKGEPGKCSVVFDHVSMRYVDASDDSISDISFSAKAGETIGIIGGTGSGKSSLVSLIPRFYDTSSGSITIDGIDIKDYSREDIRGKVSYVPQKAVLFKGTIAENLRWGNKDASDEELLRALDLSQAREFVDKKEGGMYLKERIPFKLTFNGHRFWPESKLKDEVGIISYEGVDQPKRIAFRKTLLAVNKYDGTGALRHFSKERFKELTKRYKALRKEYNSREEELKIAYSQAKKRFVTEEFWREYLGLDK
jgi:ABC-type uncharacterized transport system fused permease/ATPase subunit